LIPYYYNDDNNVCPSYFNDVHKVGKVWRDSDDPKDTGEYDDDPYKLNAGLPDGGKINEE
jgi:hypothetical protein